MMSRTSPPYVYGGALAELNALLAEVPHDSIHAAALHNGMKGKNPAQWGDKEVRKAHIALAVEHGLLKRRLAERMNRVYSIPAKSGSNRISMTGHSQGGATVPPPSSHAAVPAATTTTTASALNAAKWEPYLLSTRSSASCSPGPPPGLTPEEVSPLNEPLPPPFNAISSALGQATLQAIGEGQQVLTSAVCPPTTTPRPVESSIALAGIQAQPKEGHHHRKIKVVIPETTLRSNTARLFEEIPRSDNDARKVSLLRLRPLSAGGSSFAVRASGGSFSPGSNVVTPLFSSRNGEVKTSLQVYTVDELKIVDSIDARLSYIPLFYRLATPMDLDLRHSAAELEANVADRMETLLEDTGLDCCIQVNRVEVSLERVLCLIYYNEVGVETIAKMHRKFTTWDNLSAARKRRSLYDPTTTDFKLLIKCHDIRGIRARIAKEFGFSYCFCRPSFHGTSNPVVPTIPRPTSTATHHDAQPRTHQTSEPLRFHWADLADSFDPYYY